MPGHTGDEICRLARLHLPDRPLHIILVTATLLSVEEKVNGLGAGAEVTEFGRRLVATYRGLEQRLSEDANAAFAEFRARYRPGRDED